MKRIFTIVLIAALLLAALSLPAAATALSGTDAAATLSALGLLQGTGDGFELERTATRAEALTMLLRLLGQEEAALRSSAPCPFDDGGWAAGRIAYAWETGLVQGQSVFHFGSDDPVSVRDWLTMLLRAMGYSDAQGDFTWAGVIAFADSIGLSHGEFSASDALLREDMACLSYNALNLPMKGETGTLLQKLYLDGVVSAAALRTTRLAHVLSDAADKPVYSGVEIHDNFSPAVFLVEMYYSLEELENGEPGGHGSGFFITPDGVAALCAHELDNCEALRITTLDGRKYDVTGVLFYDTLWDAAVVRISRTDLEGSSVSRFPYLTMADSDLVRAGEPVYTLSNSLGYVDSITDGMISNRSRNVDDPDYLCIQHSAPCASGSSGGALLNVHGEVVGIQFASFVNGENMNLAVPINVISGVDLTGAGQTVAQVKESEDAKKAAATLSAEQTEFDLEYGDSVKVLISHDAPGQATIRYEIDSWDVVECVWGKFVTKRAVPLTIKAIGDGEAEITVSFADGTGGEDSSVVLHVTVTGTPEEPEEPLPSGETER